jgi:hypothetical protein
MSILIKGMKIPKKCCDCDLLPSEINWDEQWECPITEEIVHKYVEERKGKPSNCPLVEIPPHGRLIDADYMKRHLMFSQGINDCGALYAPYDEIKKEIDRMPTVIESEDE